MAASRFYVLASIVGLALSSRAHAQQASNFDVSSDVAASLDCGDECHTILQTTNAADLADTGGTDFDWDFYATAANFSSGKPGDLLKFEPVDPTNLTVISGVSAYRIQYVSEDLDGTLVPVTGFVALPNSLPLTDKFPLVAYAHGTFGVYAGCAVSNGPALWDYSSWSLLSERGYAVVGTDYAGLGNNATLHKYCSFPAHAKDVLHSVTAARQAFGAVLTDKWMAVGHSQGGGAVWRLAEDLHNGSASSSAGIPACGDGSFSPSQGDGEAANYLGTVAVAPATKIWDLAQLVLSTVGDDHSYSAVGLLPFLDIAVARVYSNYTSSILATTMKKRLELADKTQMCATAMLGLTLDLDLGNLTSLGAVGPTASDLALLAQFQNTTGAGNKVRIHGPMLVVQGVNDTAILAQITEQSWSNACAGGSDVDLLLYPKQDHSGVLTAASPDWVSWVDDRFRGLPTDGECNKTVRAPFDYAHVRAELEVDLSAFGLD